MHDSPLSLYSSDGQRKYLNQQERLRFFKAARQQSTETRLLCLLLYYTGARIAEIHNLKTHNIDLSNHTLIIETLKKRKRGIFREVPLPKFLMNDLERYVAKRKVLKKSRLWSFSIRTASRKVKKSMNIANIKGICSSSKGLRHGFAVYASTKISLTKVKKLLGHSDLKTTEIYLNTVGTEEREMVSQLWEEDIGEELEKEQKMSQTHYEQLHTLEDELIQIIGLVKALRRLLPDGDDYVCVADALGEKLNRFQYQFQKHWQTLSSMVE